MKELKTTKNRQIQKMSSLNSLGYSLTEILVVLAIATVLTLISSNFIVDTTRTASRTNIQSELDKTHLISVLSARNPTSIAKKIGLRNDDLGATIKDAALYACFSGKGTGCLDYNKSYGPFREDLGTSSTITTINVSCTATSCGNVSVDVETKQYDGTDKSKLREKVNIKPRKNQLTFASMFFADKASIDFKCSGTGILAGINPLAMKGTCRPYSGTSACPSNSPMAGLGYAAGDCAAITNKNCTGKGFSFVSLFQSGSTCN